MNNKDPRKNIIFTTFHGVTKAKQLRSSMNIIEVTTIKITETINVEDEDDNEDNTGGIQTNIGVEQNNTM